MMHRVPPHAQVEFYFSDANLPTDKHLLKQIQKDAEGYGEQSRHHQHQVFGHINLQQQG